MDFLKFDNFKFIQFKFSFLYCFNICSSFIQMLLIKTTTTSLVWKCLLIISCVLLLFINIRKDQDWGDDFAQYIHQSKNIVQRIPQYETGYIYNESYPILGPTAYTIGFPLLLSPIYALFGNNMLAFNYTITCYLIFLIIVFVGWAKKYLSNWKCILLILFFVFNPWILRFKSEINSEIPFTFVLLLILYIFDKQNYSWSNLIAIALLSGLLVSIRPIGFVVPAAIFLYMLDKLLRKKEVTKKYFFYFGVLVPFLSFVFFLLLNYVLFPVSSGIEMSHQLRVQLFNPSLSMAYQHLNLYYDIFNYFIQTNTDLPFSFIGTICKKIFMLSMILGLFLRLRKSLELSEIIFVGYLTVILFYNYSSAGFRFLFPIAPLCLLYAGVGLNQITKIIPYRKVLVVFSIIACGLLYNPDWEDIIDKQNRTQSGPMVEDSQMMFQYLTTTTKENEAILFIKPRALSLYAHRTSFSNLPNERQEVLKIQLQQNHIHYLLTSNELPNPSLAIYIKNNLTNLQMELEIGNFNLYKIVNAN